MEGKSSNAKQGARQGQALSRMMVVAIILCDWPTATSAGLDGADVIRHSADLRPAPARGGIGYHNQRGYRGIGEKMPQHDFIFRHM